MDSFQRQPRILSSMRQFWSVRAYETGLLRATCDLAKALWEFVRDSTPARLRQRYGDAEYDWDYRVNTTSGAVGWRDRLLGVLHSTYQPTDPQSFREMLATLQQKTDLDLREFTFVDLGSGKGRTLLMASDYPFRRIVGVELLPSLHDIAEENLTRYKRDSQRSFAIECICADAITFRFPNGPLVVYLFNPFPESGLRKVLKNFKQALEEDPRAAYVLYHNPLLERVFTEHSCFKKIAGTHQYSIFAA